MRTDYGVKNSIWRGRIIWLKLATEEEKLIQMPYLQANSFKLKPFELKRYHKMHSHFTDSEFVGRIVYEVGGEWVCP